MDQPRHKPVPLWDPDGRKARIQPPGHRTGLHTVWFWVNSTEYWWFSNVWLYSNIYKEGLVFSLDIQTLLVSLHPILQCLGSCPSSTPDSSFLQMHTLGIPRPMAQRARSLPPICGICLSGFYICGSICTWKCERKVFLWTKNPITSKIYWQSTDACQVFQTLILSLFFFFNLKSTA